MPREPLHLYAFEGPRALSDFRSSALLQALQRIDPTIHALSARHVHWVACGGPIDAALSARLGALLD